MSVPYSITKIYIFKVLCMSMYLQLYIESLAKITPWMFALDYIHYSRWLPVHIHDMMAFSEKHPDIVAEFHAGKFVIHKTSNKFSAMAIDQCHAK